MSEIYLYFEVYFACLIGLIFIFRRIVIDKVSEKKRRYIKLILTTSFCCILACATWDVILNGLFGITIKRKIVLCFIYLVYIALKFAFIMVWFSFAHSTFYRKSRVIGAIVHLDGFCIILVMQFMLAFYNSDYFLKISESGEVIMGSFNYILYALIYIPVIMFGVEAVINYSDKRLFAYRENIRQFFVYAILFIVTGLINLILPDAHGVILGIMAANIYLFVSSNSALVFTDELTGLDNRRQLIKNLDEKMRGTAEWFFVIFDANSFKMINDVYGHSEGDRALVYVAQALNSLSFEYKSTAYRYAGDEFVLIKEGSDELEIETMCKQVNSYLEGLCDIKSIPYKVSVSFGYVKYDENIHISIPDIIKDADEKMYEMKETVHGRR